jgi:hypothetical protein
MSELYNCVTTFCNYFHCYQSLNYTYTLDNFKFSAQIYR